ncbi:beta-galactosidase [Microbacterium sp. APC 3901]|uniref:beta-galactosidase n=1 Tax=Microbacterium sp. APC 3901 TaxID=3035192 RepID=UPI0025B625C6|nr:beta-galactosidase [Microbacterium sp. APC 3901]MDN3443080.1 beta-galactosidase [Microbacterium sp. APC 3901]
MSHHSRFSPRSLLFGGDYSPEQWPESVWREDVALMREAGVNIVTLGVFSWGLLEVDDDRWDWDWFDRIIDLLSNEGISIDLATPTASPPIWLHREHPEILPVDRRGIRYHQGGRLQWCPSHPVWQRYARRIAERLGERYGAHPSVTMWHVSNELGGGNRRCYCAASTSAFRVWLENRYEHIDAVNSAWGTAFWGHRYRRFDDVTAPLDSESAQNPSLLLDFDRFSSDALLGQFRLERDALRDAGVTTPITTNLMVSPSGSVADYASWIDDLDVVAIDHYTIAEDPRRERELAFVASRTRGLDPSRPWLVMEHSTSAVNWQRRNAPKSPGEMIRNSLQHIAHGSDGALFFQWRASASGAEQFHSAMVPHAGSDSRQWREVVELGRRLAQLDELTGSLGERSEVAILVDDVSLWAWHAGQKPLHDHPIHEDARQWFDVLSARGFGPDVVPPTSDLTGRSLIVVPSLYLVTDATVAAIEAVVRSGSTVVIGPLSGIVDADSRIRVGGYPGAFRDMLGVVGEELVPLLDGEQLLLSSGAQMADISARLRTTAADVVEVHRGGDLDGLPAITRRAVGAGAAWHISGLVGAGFDDLVDRITGDAGLVRRLPSSDDIEAVRRVSADGSWLFLINHGTTDAVVPADGTDLISGESADGRFALPAGDVAVIRERVEKRATRPV